MNPYNNKIKNDKIDSPLMDLLSDLKRKGILIRLISDGAYGLKINRYISADDYLTCQNGILLYKLQEKNFDVAYAFLRGFGEGYYAQY